MECVARHASWVQNTWHEDGTIRLDRSVAFFQIYVTFSPSSPPMMTLYCRFSFFLRVGECAKCLLTIKAKTYSRIETHAGEFSGVACRGGRLWNKYFSWSIIDDAVGLNMLVMNISINIFQSRDWRDKYDSSTNSICDLNRICFHSLGLFHSNRS